MAKPALLELHPKTRIDLQAEPTRIEGYLRAETRPQLQAAIRVLTIMLELLPAQEALDDAEREARGG